MSIQPTVTSVETLALAMRGRIIEVENGVRDVETLSGKSLATIESEYGAAIAGAVVVVENALATFMARIDNPHEVSTTQLDLDEVENLPVADQPTAEAGVSASHYVTTLRSTQQWNASYLEKVGESPETLNTIEEIAAAFLNNPDIVSEILGAIGGKLNRTEQAVDTIMFDGLTATQWVSQLLDNTFPDTNLFDNRTIAQLTATEQGIITGTSDNTFVPPSELVGVFDDTQVTSSETSDLIGEVLDILLTTVSEASDSINNASSGVLTIQVTVQ